MNSTELEVAVKAMRASHTVRLVRLLPKVFGRRPGRFTDQVGLFIELSYCRISSGSSASGSNECPMQVPPIYPI